jgi:hypothetical protein
VIECYDLIAEQANCAVHLWHHTRKANSQAASVDAARGASSFVDACRSVRVLETMTKDEAQKLNIKHGGYYFRAFSGKLNFAPPAEQSNWFRFVSVNLGNGFPFGDDVGVVEAWTHPGQNEAELTPSNVEAIRQAVGEGRWRDDVRADMWIGKAVAQALGLDHRDDVATVKKITKKLMVTGVLKIEPGKDSQRHDRVFVVLGDQSAPLDGVTRRDGDRE